MTKWRVVRFEPLDIVFNADARALGIGGFGFKGDIAPAAFAGALRTLVLKHAGWNFREQDREKQSHSAQKAACAIGYDTSTYPFRFAGPVLCRKEMETSFYWPTPSHVLCDFNAWQSGGWFVPEEFNKNAITNAGLGGLSALTAHGRGAQRPESLGGWVPTLLLRNILAGRLSSSPSAMREDAFFLQERKWGHERMPSGVIKKGQLYSRAGLRFKDTERTGKFRHPDHFAGFICLDEYLLPNGKYVVRLAGDGRPAITSVESWQGLPHHWFPAGELSQTKRLLLYLATPAIFRDGWRPVQLESEWKELLILKGAMVGRPKILGGWDIKENRPKPIRWAVPAGSIYFFLVKVGARQDIIKRFIETFTLDRSISDEDANLGYGLTLPGVWAPKPTQDSTEAIKE